MKRKVIITLSIILLCHFLKAQNINEYFISGISNKGKNKLMPYVTAGDRSYIIGNQDGKFPDMGGHVQGEMGGLWAHPIKMMDGFWVKLIDSRSGECAWLDEADEFINYPHGNKLIYSRTIDKIAVDRFQFCPDAQAGVIIEYTLKNLSGESKDIKLEFAIKTDISPVWFSKEIGINDSKDTVAWSAEQLTFIARDSQYPWHIKWGSSQQAIGHTIGNEVSLPETTKGNGIKASSSYSIKIAPKKSTTIVFVITGSDRNKEEAASIYQHLQKNYALLLKRKKDLYQVLLERAKITIPDKSLQKVYDWVKINTSWLVRTVPEVGTGLSAGYMEYPWWFGCDNTYALQAVLATGDMEFAKQTLRLLYNKSKAVNGNGRIVHEISTNGAVANRGNTQETAHFIMCVGRVYEYTGNISFIQELYPYIRQGIDWLLNTMDKNKNYFPEGYGITEVRGLNAELIDVAVYAQQALEVAALLAHVMNDTSAEQQYRQLSATLRQKINVDFWNDEESSYCDFYGTTSQALSVCKGALEQLEMENRTDEEAVKAKIYYRKLKNEIGKMPEGSHGWLTNKNWVINTPLETGIAPRDKAIRALNTIRKENCGPYGPYLSAAIDRRHMMTIATGVQAVAECRYGRIEEALWYITKIVETFGKNLPGSISEMMPDYGCFTQAWTNYGIMVPLVRYIFGVQPDALNNRIVIAPQFPAQWETGSIENVAVGNNIFSFYRKKTGKVVKYVFTRQKKQWSIVFNTEHEPGSKYYLNGKLLPGKPSLILLNEKKNEIIIKE